VADIEVPFVLSIFNKLSHEQGLVDESPFIGIIEDNQTVIGLSWLMRVGKSRLEILQSVSDDICSCWFNVLGSESVIYKYLN